MADTDPSDVDHDVIRALDRILSEGRRDPHGSHVEQILIYLHARIPVGTPARALLAIMIDNFRSYQEGRLAPGAGISTFEPVENTATMLRDAVNAGALPPLERPRTAAELAAIADRFRVRKDRHAPDGQHFDAPAVPKLDGLRVVPVGGSLDNAGRSVLEQTILLYQDLVPVAEVALATVVAWACTAGRFNHNRLVMVLVHTIGPALAKQVLVALSEAETRAETGTNATALDELDNTDDHDVVYCKWATTTEYEVPIPRRELVAAARIQQVDDGEYVTADGQLTEHAVTGSVIGAFTDLLGRYEKRTQGRVTSSVWTLYRH